MKQESYTTILLKADENKFITQADQDIDIKDRVIGTVVALGANDSPDNWKEIDAGEKDVLCDLMEDASANDI